MFKRVSETERELLVGQMEINTSARERNFISATARDSSGAESSASLKITNDTDRAV